MATSDLTPLQQERLKLFVNRVNEMQRFCAMLDGAAKPVMVVWGDIGLGKTSLLARMVHECAGRKIQKSELVWTDIRNHDYLAIMGKVRDDVGPDHFQRFSALERASRAPRPPDVVNITLQGGSVDVGKGLTVKDHSHIDTVAGVNIENVIVNSSHAERAESGRARIIELTDLFMTELAAATRNAPLVIFLDGVEKVSPDTREWIWGELLKAVGDGKLPNVRVVLLGETKLELGELQPVVEEVELQPVDKAGIIEFLAKKGIKESERDGIASYLLLTRRGNISAIANDVDTYLRGVHAS